MGRVASVCARLRLWLDPKSWLGSAVIAIMASILAARKLAQFDSSARVPATINAIADAVRWAERIMEEVDRRCRGDRMPKNKRRASLELVSAQDGFTRLGARPVRWCLWHARLAFSDFPRVLNYLPFGFRTAGYLAYGSGQTGHSHRPKILVKKYGPCSWGGTMIALEYAWEYEYVFALLERDDARLPDRISSAELAITSRLDVFKKDHGGTPEELSAIVTAVAGLEKLRLRATRRRTIQSWVIDPKESQTQKCRSLTAAPATRGDFFRLRPSGKLLSKTGGYTNHPGKAAPVGSCEIAIFQ